MAIIRTNIDPTANKDLLKIGTLRKIFDNTMRKTQSFYAQWTNDLKTNLEEESDLRMASPVGAGELAEGQNIPMRVPEIGTKKTYNMRRFGAGLRMTHFMDFFNKYKLWSRWFKKLGQMMIESKDIEVHTMFNDPTSIVLKCGVGFDTLAIASASHTGLNPNISTDDYSNYLNAALSHSSLESGRYYFATLIDDQGSYMGGRANKLIYHPYLHFTAVELTGSLLKPGEMSNTTNKTISQMGLQLFENPRLTSETAWNLADTANDDYDFNVYTGMAPNMITKDAPDTTRDKIATALQYFTYGWGDPRLLLVGKT